jgi:hypothetical protein
MFSDFEACAQEALPYSGHSIPFFHSLLARPSPTLRRILGYFREMQFNITHCPCSIHCQFGI